MSISGSESGSMLCSWSQESSENSRFYRLADPFLLCLPCASELANSGLADRASSKAQVAILYIFYFLFQPL